MDHLSVCVVIKQEDRKFKLQTLKLSKMKEKIFLSDGCRSKAAEVGVLGEKTRGETSSLYPPVSVP